MALVGQFEPQACLGDTPGLFRPTTQPTSLLHPEFFPLQSVAIQFATHSWHIPRGEKEEEAEEEGEYDGRLVSERVSFLASYIIPKPPPSSPTMAFAELCVPGVRESVFKNDEALEHTQISPNCGLQPSAETEEKAEETKVAENAGTDDLRNRKIQWKVHTDWALQFTVQFITHWRNP